MYRNFKIKIMVLAFVSVCLLAATANAACGDSNKLGASLHRQSWKGSDGLQFGFLLRISDSSDPIVGMWHVTLTAQGNEVGPPDGAPIDNALVTWHSDGTELMNSARPPQDGNFCMGVWKRTGRYTYKLNHFAWLANDTAGAPSGISNLNRNPAIRSSSYPPGAGRPCRDYRVARSGVRVAPETGRHEGARGSGAGTGWVQAR